MKKIFLIIAAILVLALSACNNNKSDKEQVNNEETETSDVAQNEVEDEDTVIETDEEIAEKTGIKLNSVRKILYKLYDLKIANYKRSKDPETQWFTYSWKFEKDELISKIKKDTEIELSKLNAQLEEEEQNMFFVCPYGHVRVNFDVASDYDYQFLCPACDEELEFQDNAEIIENLKANIAMVENDYDSFIKKVES